jgi:ribosomal RNA-processing protein 36
LFEKSYGFLKDYKKSEQDMLKQRMKKEKDSEALDQMKGLLTQMVNEGIY